MATLRTGWLWEVACYMPWLHWCPMRLLPKLACFLPAQDDHGEIVIHQAMV